VVELVKEGFVPVIVDNFSNTDESAMTGLEKIIGTKPILYKYDCTDAQLMNNMTARMPN